MLLLFILFNLFTFSDVKFVCGESEYDYNSDTKIFLEKYYYKNDLVNICIHFKEKKIKTSVKTLIDNNKTVIITGIYDNITKDNKIKTDITLKFQVEGELTTMNLEIPYIKYFNNEEQIFDFWDIIIVLEKGKIKLLTFDPGCWFCNDNLCKNDLGIFFGDKLINKIKYCSLSKEAKNKDLKLTFYYLGTDFNGDHINSASNRQFLNPKNKEFIDKIRNINTPLKKNILNI